MAARIRSKKSPRCSCIVSVTSLTFFILYVQVLMFTGVNIAKINDLIRAKIDALDEVKAQPRKKSQEAHAVASKHAMAVKTKVIQDKKPTQKSTPESASQRREKRQEARTASQYAMAIKMNMSQNQKPIDLNLHSIITGLEHSGTTITGRLVMNAPCLVGATETGFLLADSPQDIGDVHPWYGWNIDDGKDTDKKKMMYLLSPEVYEKMKAARNFSEMYYILRENSHLFNNLNDKYDDGRECEKPTRIVDKTPRYVRPQYLEKILIKTPGVPVLILKKPLKETRIGLTKKQYDQIFDNVDKMMKKYPGRIKILYYDKFTENPEKVMGEVFEFLGLTWKDEYLKMTGLKQKFSVYPEVAKQIGEWEFVAGGHSPEGSTVFH